MRVFLSGNEAVALGARHSGLGFASAYPGTPSTEILETIAGFDEIDCQWAANEKVAYEVAYSAAVGGMRSLFACKHVGLNVAMDPLMSSAYSGVNAGFVIVVADDPGLHSSQNEQDSRWVARMAKLIMLEPASPSEAYRFVQAAFDISERFDLPVMVRLTTRVSHTKESFEAMDKADGSITRRGFEKRPEKYVLVPKYAYQRHIDLEKRLAEAAQCIPSLGLNTIEEGAGRRAFITGGVGYLYVKEAFPDAPVLKLGCSWPLDESAIRGFASQYEEVYVIEELDGVLERDIKALGINAKAKPKEFCVGELSADIVKAVVNGEPAPKDTAAKRKPVFCPGCGHRPVFTVLKKIGAVVVGDIGCYTLGATPPLSALHTCLCMGASVSFLEGFGHAGVENVVGVIGDSTFYHTGVPALMSLAYNWGRGVLLVLDNSTTGMTGNQPHPGTGIDIRGGQKKRIVLEEIAKAAGADTVDVINPYDINGLEALIRKRLDEALVSVIICRYPCRFVDRSKNPPYSVNKDICRRCGLCFGIDCPAIAGQKGESPSIHAQLCVGCGLCAKVCPFGAIVQAG